MEATIVWEPRTAIWFALKEDGESQKQLADRTGIDPSKLSRMLSGETKKIGIDDLRAIAAAQSRPLEFYWELPTVIPGGDDQAPIIHGMPLPRWFDSPIEEFDIDAELEAA